jgi:hypothetical protein
MPVKLPPLRKTGGTLMEVPVGTTVYTYPGAIHVDDNDGMWLGAYHTYSLVPTHEPMQKSGHTMRVERLTDSTWKVWMSEGQRIEPSQRLLDFQGRGPGFNIQEITELG